MTRYEKAMTLKPSDFKQIIGIAPATYADMLEAITQTYAIKHKNGGKPAKLPLTDQLFMALKYWRQYVTQKELAYEFEVGEATVYDTVVWAEDTLVKCGKFILPGKKSLLKNIRIDIVLVDVTESPIERPKKTASVVFRKKEAAHK